jgi:hypothetical protein
MTNDEAPMTNGPVSDAVKAIDLGIGHSDLVIGHSDFAIRHSRSASWSRS